MYYMYLAGSGLEKSPGYCAYLYLELHASWNLSAWCSQNTDIGSWHPTCDCIFENKNHGLAVTLLWSGRKQEHKGL